MISVVFYAASKAKYLKPFIQELQTALPPVNAEVFVVDGGRQDIPDIMSAISQTGAKVYSVKSSPVNTPYAGFHLAALQAQGNMQVYLDTDYQLDAGVLPRMAKSQGALVAKGFDRAELGGEEHITDGRILGDVVAFPSRWYSSGADGAARWTSAYAGLGGYRLCGIMAYMGFPARIVQVPGIVAREFAGRLDMVVGRVDAPMWDSLERLDDGVPFQELGVPVPRIDPRVDYHSLIKQLLTASGASAATKHGTARGYMNAVREDIELAYRKGVIPFHPDVRLYGDQLAVVGAKPMFS